MKIHNAEQYRQALARYNELTASGATVKDSRELADLEAEIHAFDLEPDEPASSPGHPAAEPYGSAGETRKTPLAR